MRLHLDALAKLEFDKIREHIARYTGSEPGREHAVHLQPMDDPEAIRRSLATVSEMKLLLETDDSLPLDHLPDVRISLQRASIENYILNPDELHAIALLLGTTQKISVYFSRRKSSYPLLFEETAPLQFDKILKYNIDQAIDEQGLVKDNATRELSRIRKERFTHQNSLKKTLERILKEVGGKEWVQEEIITTREGRMVIPIKVEHKNRVPGFIQGNSASGQTVYIEPTETLELNNTIRTLEFEERREVEKLLRALTDQVRGARGGIETSMRILSRVDFLQALAKYSIEILGSAPAIRTDGGCKFVRAYHPILLQKHKRSTIVPLDLETGSEKRTLLITGPNAGGKSVAMKTVGLLTILAQSGCHIPASGESVIRVYSDLFIDMGDEQSIENDLSSFSSHLNNLKFIFDRANGDSLILLDELGSGTDPLEGASIAASVLQEFSVRGCTTIATTHHGSLKAFAFKHPNIENCAMEFDQATLRPTYRFRAGTPGSSYALEMAERMHFPQEALARAREFKGTQSTALEDLILSLESQSAEMRERLDALTKEREVLNASISLYESKLITIETEAKSIRSKALQEAQEILSTAKSSVENAVREIREQSARKEVVASARKAIAEVAKKVEKETVQAIEAEERFEADLKPGVYVRLSGTTSEGELAEIVDEKYAIVVMGAMRARVLRKNLQPISPPKKLRESYTLSVEETPATTEVDLRGMYGDEALEAVAKFIDTAILRGIHRVDIIHGKGTGALRKKVTEYLKSHPSVKSYRLGEWNEGGTGVTVVELT